MNTPSKEALEAAKEFRATVVGLSNDSTDKLAAIIDRHFEPLRRQVAELTKDNEDYRFESSLMRGRLHMTPDEIRKQNERAEQAEARVKELETDASFHWVTEEELKQVRADNAALRAALDAARKETRQ